MKIKIDRKKLLIFGGVAFVLILVLGLLFLCRPMISEIRTLSDQEKVYTQETSLAKDLLATKNTDKIKAQLTAMGKASFVVDTIKEMARKYNVTLRLVRPPFVGSDMKGISGRILFDMQASSSLKALGLFMTAVRDMPQGLVAIEAFRVLPDEANADVVNTNITFILLVAKGNGK